MREDGSIMVDSHLLCFLESLCGRCEPHIGSLKDLEAFRISEDVSLIGIGLLMYVNEDLFFSKQ